MAEFICTGTITLVGVTFFIEAETKEEAQLRASNGRFSGYDASRAELCDCDMHDETVELSE